MNSTTSPALRLPIPAWCITLTALLFLTLAPATVRCQGSLLDKQITLKLRERSLSQTLHDIGAKGDFYFSYNSNILKGDSIVHLNADHRTIRQILDTLLGRRYDYIESGRYIILQVKAGLTQTGKGYTISGWVVDSDTKRTISRASIYAADQLISTLTDSNGYFRLRLKEKNTRPTITVSKELYRDTLLVIPEGYDQTFTFSIEPARVSELTPFVVSSRVEKAWLGRFFLSSREKIQSLNLLNFFASKPIQFSLTPGLGTHGQMGSQVINKFSLNVLGGYTAGSNGLEMAGLFNIDKKDVNYVQVAGIFNLVGGKMNGVQLAGTFNNDLDSAKGVQAGGLVNRVHLTFSGLQLAGLVNKVQEDANGMQAAGLINYTQDSTRGLQLAGIGNISKEEIKGVQIAGIFNSTRHLKGLQLGLINIADTVDGLMIGLLNITKNGYHPLSLFSNEITPLNLAYKVGSRKTYSILLAGMDPRSDRRIYMMGYGIGAGFGLSSKWSVSTDLTAQYFYTGNWTGTPVVYRLQPTLQYQCTKKIAFFTGPAISLYDPNQAVAEKGYKLPLPENAGRTFTIGNTRAWIGWTVGINFF